jgi:hypothetical protein
MAISSHITSPCYRHSYIIGAVFSEITVPTLPIIYHIWEETEPIIPLFGTVWQIVLAGFLVFEHLYHEEEKSEKIALKKICD